MSAARARTVLNGVDRRNLLGDGGSSQINPQGVRRRERGVLLRPTQLAPTTRAEIALTVTLEVRQRARGNT